MFLSAESASIVDVEKPVSETACEPKARTDTRSAGGLAAMKACAAAVAWGSAGPFIDAERAIAITTLFDAPTFVASTPATGAAVCATPGATEAGDGGATGPLPRGNPAVSTALTSPAANAAGTRIRAAS